MTKRIAYSIALAALCTLVLATHVSLRFERLRYGVIGSPHVAEAATMTIPLHQAVDASPAAIILRLGGAAQPMTVVVKFDGDDLARVRLPGGREVRVDASVSSRIGPGHQLVLAGDRPGWRLLSLEVANVHGFSSGLFSIHVVPRGRRHLPVSAVLIGLVGAALIVARSVVAPALRRTTGRWQGAISAGVVLLFIAVVVSERLTRYKVLLTPRTFALCVALLYADVVVAITWRLFDRLRRGVPRGIASIQQKTGVRWGPSAAAALACSVGVVAVTYGSHVAGAADPYGYISQSAMWAQGRLTISQPVVHELPAGLDERALAPLGYMPHAASGIRGQLVPTYAPGLPLVMAGLQRLGGANGIRLTVPLLAALTIWLTFLLGRRVYGDATGLFAAAWLSCSPAFVDSMWSPMSDVPATAWWLAAIVAAFDPGGVRAIASGLAASLGVLTRPNLVPLTMVVAAPWVWRWWRDRTNRPHVAAQLAIFGAVALIGPLTVAALFTFWYGSPLRSAYGELRDLCSWRYVMPNLASYSGWLIQTQTPLVLAAAFAPVLARRRFITSTPQTARAHLWLMLAFSGLVWALYLVYLPWPSWGFLRFMLPSFPFLITMAGAVLVTIASWTRAPVIVGGGLLALVCWRGADFLVDKGIPYEKAKDVRYQRVAAFVAQTLPPRAMLFGGLHSGSLRYYAGRTTLRWQFVAPDALDGTMAMLRERGFYPYFVLEYGEQQEFREHFETHSRFGALDWEPMATAPGETSVNIYDPRQRGGERVSTIIIE